MNARIAHIASNTFREAVRDRVLYNLIAFAVLLSAAAIFIGQISIEIERLVVVNLGLTAVTLFGVVIAIFVGIGLVSKEIEKRTLYTVLSRPVRRWEFIVGKFFGLAATLVVNTFFMAIGVFGALLYVAHTFSRPDGSILVALYFIILQFLIILFPAALGGFRVLLVRNRQLCGGSPRIRHHDPWLDPLDGHGLGLPGAQLFRLERHQRGRSPAAHQLATDFTEHVLRLVLHRNGIEWSRSHLRPQGFEMSSRNRTTLIAGTCLLVSLLASSFLRQPIDRIRPRGIADDALYITSAKMVRKASLGFEGLMACIYWTRTVQYFGHRHFNRAHTYNQLAPLLEITVALDPQMLPAYQFGASFLAPAPPVGAGQPERAVRLIRYGIEHNPGNWRLYYDLGFVYYTELHDYKQAGEAFARGSEVPGAHPFMKILAANMAEHARDFNTARLLWRAAYDSSQETNIRQNALEHLRAIQVDEDVTNLQNAVTRFVQANGRNPTSLWEVVDAEHGRGLPLDPDGRPYELSVDGQVLVANPDDFPFITLGLPPGYKPGVPKFHTKG